MKSKHENTVNKELREKYLRAKKRVADMQGVFYHIAVYVIINITLFILRPKINTWAEAKLQSEPEFLRWVDLNILLTPILWGLVLLIHYLVVFGFNPPIIKKWEQRKIAEIMENNKPG